jgi:hypothetical protein
MHTEVTVPRCNALSIDTSICHLGVGIIRAEIKIAMDLQLIHLKQY